MPRPVSLSACPSRQRGMAAIEFALVSSIFFTMFYFIVSYGAVFIVQQSLSRAAAEGARALLVSEFAPAPGTGTYAATVVPPEQVGRDTAARVVAWLSNFRQTRAKPQPAIAPVVAASSSCVSDMACRTVTVTYEDYRTYPLIPNLLPARAVPQRLTASATVQLDKAQWARAGGGS